MAKIFSQKITKEWTLFLDRDGVINRRLMQRYVQDWEQFEFLPGVLEAIAKFNDFFGRIVVVTNQRGIGRGLMTEEQLKVIHFKMLREIEENDGRIDDVFYCSKRYDEKPDCRKPDPFMAFQAQSKYPEINFEKSIMVGDQPGDIKFGTNLNMRTVWIPNDEEIKWEESSYTPNYVYPSLYEFSKEII